MKKNPTIITIPKPTRTVKHAIAVFVRPSSSYMSLRIGTISLAFTNQPR